MINIEIETDAVKKYLDKAIRQFKPKIAKQVYYTVVLRTPVRTGRARFSWDISSGNFKDAPPEGQYGYPSMPVVPITDADIHIYNPLDYITELNEGNSKQAPAMFVELSVWDVIFRNRTTTGRT